MSESEKSNSAMAAFSSKLTDLSDALDILYITNNASARHRFRESWPEIADYLFGATLMQYDIEGVDAEQRAHRQELEEDAEIRRIELKQTIREIVEKSVKSGMLQFDYVGSVIDKHGPVVAYYLYAEDIIKRVRPDVAEQVKQIRGSDDQNDEAEDQKEELPAAVDGVAQIESESLAEDMPQEPETLIDVPQNPAMSDTGGEQSADILGTQQDSVFPQHDPVEGGAFDPSEVQQYLEGDVIHIKMGDVTGEQTEEGVLSDAEKTILSNRDVADQNEAVEIDADNTSLFDNEVTEIDTSPDVMDSNEDLPDMQEHSPSEDFQPVVPPDLSNPQEAIAAQNVPPDMQEVLSGEGAQDLHDGDDFVKEPSQDPPQQQEPLHPLVDQEGGKPENNDDEGIKD
ncbi:MAG: hypothetical protein ACLFP8_03755 [Alphaproteobacteria bacterium]